MIRRLQLRSQRLQISRMTRSKTQCKSKAVVGGGDLMMVSLLQMTVKKRPHLVPHSHESETPVKIEPVLISKTKM